MVGDGPVDMLVTHPPWFPVDLIWDEPRLVYFLNRLSGFSRHIWFDVRGTGASDGVAQTESRLVESQVDDMVTVLDHVGWERAVLLGFSGVGPNPLFAAVHPQRTSALVLVNEIARARQADDYPEGLPDEVIDQRRVSSEGTGYPPWEQFAPSLVDDARFGRWFDRARRLTCSPNDALAKLRLAWDADQRGSLRSIQAPTLVVSRRDRPFAAATRYLADHIQGAQYVELEGEDMFPFLGDADAVLDAIEEFVSGQLPAPRADRVLATVLFTDLVSSTPQVAQMGDRRWRNLIATHDALVRAELDRFRGREVKFDGDGVLATFDGPGRAIRCACAIRDALGALGLQVRAGLHTGEVELRGGDITGIAVHIGQRVSAHAGPGEVFVSRTVADLIAGSDIELRDQGEHELKGVPGTWRLYSVRD
jgi:class 3 adenylate cyclase/pimeloyl-ACP methyl ester carboxylesterase